MKRVQHIMGLLLRAISLSLRLESSDSAPSLTALVCHGSMNVLRVYSVIILEAVGCVCVHVCMQGLYPMDSK